ncbi:unnamed protein product [Camellia sinensis]
MKKLGVIERKNLLERPVKIAEDDNEKFLLKLKKRIDKLGMIFPPLKSDRGKPGRRRGKRKERIAN